jgi:hypothetical protein
MSRTLLSFLAIHFSTALSIGDRLVRDYTEYYNMPSNASAAMAAGWVQQGNGDCDPNLGIVWSQTKAGATEAEPLVLYFTPSGQAAGVGVRFRGQQPQHLINLGLLEPFPEGGYFASVTFRSPSDICATNISPLVLGDMLVLNSAGAHVVLPLTAAAALQAWGHTGSATFLPTAQ